MKYLAIILILFTVPAFAQTDDTNKNYQLSGYEYDKNFPPLGSEICYVVDTPQWKPHEPTPINPSPRLNVSTQTLESIFDWVIVISDPLAP